MKETGMLHDVALGPGEGEIDEAWVVTKMSDRLKPDTEGHLTFEVGQYVVYSPHD